MRLVDYIKETKAELAHVSWPTKRQALIFTILVVIFSFATAAYLGLFDVIFTWALKLVIE